MGRTGDVSGTFHFVHLLSQGGEAVDQDLQPPLQSAQTGVHVCVALLQLANLLVLLPSRLDGDELLQLGAELTLLIPQTVNALLHVKRVAFQHAQALVEGVQVKPEQVLEAGVPALWAGREVWWEPGYCSVWGD